MIKNARISLPVTAFALLLAGASAPRALASGFQLREQSASAQGTAYAGIAAGGADISGMFFNPATLTGFDGFQLVFGGTEVAPKADLNEATGSRASLMGLSTYGNTPISGSSSLPNAGKSAVLPELYAMWSVTKDFKLGFSLNAPFGLTSNYANTSVGRYHALDSSLKTVDLGLNAAYRVLPSVSVGASLISRHVDATLSNAVDFGEIAYVGLMYQSLTATSPVAAATAAAEAAPFTPGATKDTTYDGQATVRGTSNVTAYKLGVTYQPLPSFRLGLGYQSATTVKINGSISYDYPTAAVPQVQQILNGVIQQGHINNGTVQASVNLPSTFSLGMNWDVTPAVTLGFEADRTGWSSFQQLNFNFGSGQTPSITDENWHNTMFYSLGATWKYSEALSLRAGLAKDQSAVDATYRTPRIPDANRTWLSLGLGYAFTKQFSMDAAYTYIMVQDGTMDLATTNAITSPNYFRGNLTGTYNNSIQIFALQARLSF